MKAFILITLAAVFSLTVLLTGCGSSEQTVAVSMPLRPITKVMIA